MAAMCPSSWIIQQKNAVAHKPLSSTINVRVTAAAKEMFILRTVFPSLTLIAVIRIKKNFRIDPDSVYSYLKMKMRAR